MTAQAIIGWRDEHGGFTAVDQLLDVDGIGEATLSQIAPLVTVLTGWRRSRRAPAAAADLRLPAVGAGRLGGWARRAAAGRGLVGRSRSPWRAAGLVVLRPGAAGRRRDGRTSAWPAGLRGGGRPAPRCRVHQVAHNPVADARPGAAQRVTADAVGRAPTRGCGRGGSPTTWCSAAGSPRSTAGRRDVPRSAHRCWSSRGAGRGREVRWARSVRVPGRLGDRRGPGPVGACCGPRSRPVRASRSRPSWWRVADRVRASLRESVAGVPEPHRGRWCRPWWWATTTGLDPALAEDFSHHRADPPARGVRHEPDPAPGLRAGGRRAGWACAGGGRYVRRARPGIVGFVLLARPEPSVLRAAVMGSVALVGLGAGGARRGTRSLGVAVTVLLLVDPWLALLPGFALSVLATAGIVFLAPALARRAARLAAALAGRGGGGPGGRAAGVHAGGGRAVRAGQPGRGAGQPARGARGRTGHGARPGRRAGRAGLAAGWAGCSGPLAGWCVAWIAHGGPAGRRAADAQRSTGARAGWSLAAADRALPRWCCWPRRGCCAGAGRRRLGCLRAGRSWSWSGLPDAGLAAVGLGARRLRRRPGRRAGAQRRRRARPSSSTPAPTLVRSTGACDRLEVDRVPAAGAHPLPRRPRRRAGRGAARPAASARSR